MKMIKYCILVLLILVSCGSFLLAETASERIARMKKEREAAIQNIEAAKQSGHPEDILNEDARNVSDFDLLREQIDVLHGRVDDLKKDVVTRPPYAGPSGINFADFLLVSDEVVNPYFINKNEVKSGYIEVYKDEVKDAFNNKPIQAGISGGIFNTYKVYDSNAPTQYVTINEVILVNDRSPSGDNVSAIVSIPYAEFDDVIKGKVDETVIENDKIGYKTPWLLSNAVKYESATITKDKSRVIVSTALNTLDDSSGDRTRYSSFMSWKKGKSNSVSLTYPTLRGNYLSSDDLRKEIQSVLRKNIDSSISWFDMEGMTIIDDQTLLFGVRQIASGLNASGFVNLRNVAVLLSAGYEVDEDGVLSVGNIKFVMNLTDSNGLVDLNEILFEKVPEASKVIKTGLGISSMEYDYEKGRLYFMTTYEENGGNVRDDDGTYLWIIDIDLDSKTYSKPYLVVNVEQDKFVPAYFSNKMEALVLLPNDYILVVADDDKIIDAPDSKVVIKRDKLNHAIYKIIKVEKHPGV